MCPSTVLRARSFRYHRANYNRKVGTAVSLRLMRWLRLMGWLRWLGWLRWVWVVSMLVVRGLGRGEKGKERKMSKYLTTDATESTDKGKDKSISRGDAEARGKRRVLDRINRMNRMGRKEEGFWKGLTFCRLREDQDGEKRHCVAVAGRNRSVCRSYPDGRKRCS